MARVTKINVGGTNYDIAHEGELKNSGFEVVTSLPTTGLFAGRQVTYNGRNYVYNGRTWIDLYNPVPILVEPYPYTMTTEELNHGATAIGGTVSIQLLNSISSSLLSVIDDVSGDNYLIETNDGSGWSVVNGPVSRYRHIPVGSSIRYTAFKDMNQSPAALGYFFAVYKEGNHRLKTTSRYDIEFYFPNDNGVAHWKTVYSQQFDKDEGNYWFFPVQKYWRLGTNSNQEITNARITITTISSTDASFPETIVSHIKFLTNLQLSSKTTPVYINYDAVINPTQSTKEYKTIEWVLQYLVQGVNWVKANNVRLSAYNTKVAALEQADSDNNASIQSVSSDLTELSNSLATVATSGSYNDLTDKPTFSGSYNDLTDKPTLAAVATSGSYNDLTDKPTFSGSYNDLTDKPTLFSGSYEDLTNKPTLATVATSGSYNDLTDKPTFSGSYNDLTDKPTLFSGSYNDLTDKPNLATVATSGSYADLLNKPDLVFSNIGGNIAPAQITDGSITNDKLAYSSMTLNGITVNLGNIVNLPCFISVGGTLYHARIENNWLQIYRAGIWVNTFYLLTYQPTVCRYITDLSDPSWYDESVTEYELDNSATTQLLDANSSTNIANWIKEIGAQQITFNSSVIPKRFNKKGALDNIISNLKGNGYSVFVENDLDTILQSGSDYLVRIKISKVPTAKAIIECYVAR